jgi:hypothetical protein
MITLAALLLAFAATAALLIALVNLLLAAPNSRRTLP